VRHGAPRVAGSGDENRQRPGFPAHKVAHQPRHESRPEVLERQGGTVKQLENVKARRERYQLHRKVDRLRDNLPQHFFGHVRRGEGPNHAETNFRERQTAKFLQFLRRMPRDFRGHIEPAVRREPAQHRTAKRGQP